MNFCTNAPSIYAIDYIYATITTDMKEKLTGNLTDFIIKTAKKKNMTLYALARGAGIDESFFYKQRTRNGGRNNYRMYVLNAIFRVLELSLTDVFRYLCSEGMFPESSIGTWDRAEYDDNSSLSDVIRAMEFSQATITMIRKHVSAEAIEGRIPLTVFQLIEASIRSDFTPDCVLEILQDYSKAHKILPIRRNWNIGRAL